MSKMGYNLIIQNKGVAAWRDLVKNDGYAANQDAGGLDHRMYQTQKR